MRLLLDTTSAQARDALEAADLKTSSSLPALLPSGEERLSGKRMRTSSRPGG